MTIQVFCPKWYYQGQLSEENQTEVRDLFSDFLSNSDNFAQPETWKCNVTSSFQTEGNMNAPWDKFMNIMKPSFDELIDQTGALQEIQVLIENAWANKYNPGDSQEYHDHCTPSSNLSMVYFYELNDDDGCEFVFYNGEHAPYKLSGLADTIMCPVEMVTKPKVSQGDVLFFPSHYPHLVSPHRGTRERITFSANFKVIPKGFGDS
jgi:hypothetical protein